MHAADIFLQEDINFLVTNRIPRRYATLLAGRLSRFRTRRFTRFSVTVWNLFDDLHLEEATTRDFASIRDCFIRELREGMRTIDPNLNVVTSRNWSFQTLEREVRANMVYRMFSGRGRGLGRAALLT